MIASHNQDSIEGAVALMRQLGLPPSNGVFFGQLLGMADHLTFTLGAHGYGVRAASANAPSFIAMQLGLEWALPPSRT